LLFIFKSINTSQGYSYTNKNTEKKKAGKLLHLGNITERQSEILSLYIENPDMVLVSTDIVGKFGVTPNTTKSDLRKLTEKGYLSEISLNGRTKGYVNTFPD
jgi:Fic family protein